MAETSSDLVLAIDTSGPRLQLALAGEAGAEVLIEEIAKGHAEILFGRIAALLAENQRAYADLTRIAVTTGPGSFTGLRIGISAARGLGLALNIPVIGVPNLFALSLSTAHGPIDVVLDARRSEYYVQSFIAPGVPDSQPALIPGEAALASYPRPDATCITDPQVDIAHLAQFALSADPAIYPPDPTYIRAADAKPQTTKLIARAETSA